MSIIISAVGIFLSKFVRMSSVILMSAVSVDNFALYTDFIFKQFCLEMVAKPETVLQIVGSVAERKHCFYGDHVIIIMWSRFNDHLHRTHSCFLG